jgi:zinc protease
VEAISSIVRSLRRIGEKEKAMINKIGYIGICLFFLSASASGQGLPKIHFEKFVLKNGLQVILHEDHTVPVVAVNVWYHVGSHNEKVGRTGFAHLFEHMMFKGSEHHPSEYFTPLQKIGGAINGSTSEDRTNYWENVPANYLELALWLESDRMGFLLPAMTQDKLDIQRNVVKNERRQGLENQPYGKVEELLPALLYPADHPYSWTVIGSQEDLSRASKEDIEEFFKTYYAPNNASLCIAGDFNPGTARALAEKYFADIPPGPAIDRLGTWIPALNGEKRMTAEDRVSLPRLYIAWHTPPYYAPGDAELDILGSILSGGKTSRLYKSLVYDRQIAQDVRAYQSSREIGGNFQIEVTAKPGCGLEEIEKAVDRELDVLKEGGVTEAEMIQAKNNFESDFVRRLENIGGFGGKADRLNEYNVMLGDPDRFQWDLDRHLNLTAADIRTAAGRFLGVDRVVLSILPSGDLKAGVAAVDRAVEPKPAAEPGFNPPAVQRAVLRNGLEVLVVEDHKLPVVNMTLVVRSGWASDPENRPGAASLMSELLDEGTATRSALEIAEEVKTLGADLGTTSSFDASQVNLEILKKELDRGLALLSEIVIHPSFPAGELERQRRIYLGRIEQEAMQPNTSAMKVFYRALYGPDHPYAQPYTGSGTESSIKALTRDDLVRTWKTAYHPNNAAFVAVGDVTLKEMTAKLEAAFGDWASGKVPEASIPAVKPPSGTKIFLVDKPGAAQSVVIAGNFGIERSSPDYFAVQVLNTALGGKFTSRINLNLREDKGYTYGARSNFTATRSTGAFMVSAPVQSQYTKETVFEIERELRGICGEKPLSAEELLDCRNYLIKGFSQRFSSTGWVAGQLADQVKFGLPGNTLARYIPSVQAVTEAATTASAWKYIHPGALLYVIVGDVAKIESGLRDLKIGDIGYLDASGNPVRR